MLNAGTLSDFADLNVRLAGDYLFGKLLFTWMSLVVSMMVSFVLSFFPRDVLDEILNLIESVSEGFPSYSIIIINRSQHEFFVPIGFITSTNTGYRTILFFDI